MLRPRGRVVPEGVRPFTLPRDDNENKTIRPQTRHVIQEATKQQPDELFQRKTEEAKTIPDYSDVVESLDKIYSTIDEYLKGLESSFDGHSGTEVVLSEKTSSYVERTVRAFKVT